MVEARISTEEVETVTSPSGLVAPQIGEDDAVGKLPVPGTPCKDGSALRIDFGDDVRCGGAPLNPQYPFGVGRDRKPSTALRLRADRTAP